MTTAFSEFDAGFLVGLIEGEGSVMLNQTGAVGPTGSRYYVAIVVIVTNTRVELVDAAKDCLDRAGFKSYRVRYHRQGPKAYGRKPMYTLSVTGMESCEALLKALSPRMVIKRRQAELILEYCRQRLTVEKRRGSRKAYTLLEHGIRHEIRSLNGHPNEGVVA